MTSFANKLIIAVVLAIGLAVTSFFFPVVPAVQNLCTWIGSLGPLGVFLLSLLLAIGSLFFMPASPFIIAGAAVFGFPLGVLGGLAGVALGAAGGFSLSRWFLRNDISTRLRKHATFRAIDTAIEKEGWKIVILLRLCPIPFGLANYLYGLTAVPFRAYVTASVIGSLPGLLLFCQLGSAGKAELEAIASGHIGNSAGELIVLSISIASTIAAIVLLPRFARKAVAKYTHVSLPS
ncbi:MAG TPA: VTT domain-containing protein [Chthoniobacterales bacterium]|nr:VTT domain-containing protein [Chthoniobacterales bacterium]